MGNFRKEPVRIRKKKLANGNISLYLDIYYNGERKYEFLKLYLIPEKNKLDREANKNTLGFAEAVKARRIIELQEGRFNPSSAKGSRIFVDYYKECAERKSNASTRDTCLQSLKLLEIYLDGRELKLCEITSNWVEQYKQYLDNTAVAHQVDKRKRSGEKTPLSPGTKQLYFSKLIAVINSAIKEGLISEDPTKKVKRFPKPHTEREYLTIEELRTLANTECPMPIAKDIFLFSCMTGLRWSDVSTLRWSNIETMGDMSRIKYRQQKTQKFEYLDLSPEAKDILDRIEKDGDLVFKDLPRRTTINIIISKWVTAAGIQKHISFHCARHTFALLLLDNGVDLYTVSKLLGHSDITTTQIYAHILDKRKQAAVLNIPKIF